jgi:hypothetical protein
VSQTPDQAIVSTRGTAFSLSARSSSGPTPLDRASAASLKLIGAVTQDAVWYQDINFSPGFGESFLAADVRQLR